MSNYQLTQQQQIAVEYMDHMGTDDSIVNAARVSFDRSASHYTPEANAKLISYLGNHKHEIPFAHTAITLRVRAPISIRTQCFKHKVGFVENEVSRRYVRSTPSVYLPTFRTVPEKSIKQGSGEVIKDLYYYRYLRTSDGKQIYVSGKTEEELTNSLKEHGITLKDPVYEVYHTDQDKIRSEYITIVENLVREYERMIDLGIAPEQARFILPQGTMTEWVWTGSLLAFARFVNLRKTPYAQTEVREVADKVSEIIEPLFPLAWKALTSE